MCVRGVKITWAVFKAKQLIRKYVHVLSSCLDKRLPSYLDYIISGTLAVNIHTKKSSRLPTKNTLFVELTVRLHV